MSLDNKYKEIFNDVDSVSDEDWLSPDDGLFDKILDEVEEDDDDEDTGIVWIKLLPIFVLIVAGTLLFKINLSEENIQDQLSTTISKATKETNIEGYDLTEVDQAVMKDDANIDVKNHFQDEVNDPIKKEVIAARSSVKYETVTDDVIRKPTDPTLINSLKSKSTGNNDVANTFKEKFGSDLGNGINQSNDRKRIKSYQIENSVNNTTRNVKELDQISTIHILQLEDMPTINDFFPLKIRNKERHNSLWFFTSLSYNSVEFNLSKDYLNLLDGAEFYKSKANGFSWHFGAAKLFNNGFSLNASMGLRWLTFNSGHNSDVVYSGQVGSQENIALTMATPVGLLNSAIIVRKLDAGGNTTDTVSTALKNGHDMVDFTYRLGLSKSLRLVNKWNLDIHLDAGSNHLLLLKNKFLESNLDNQNFVVTDRSIEGKQMDINRWRPFVGGAIGLSYTNTNHKIALQVNKDFEIRPIFQNGNLQTSLESLAINLTWSRRLN